jgi:hypothetical protein
LRLRQAVAQYAVKRFGWQETDMTSLVFPMFAMVLLTFGVVIRMFRARVAAVRAGEIPASYFRLYQGAVEPESTAKISRHFTNLFEAPTLFYAGCLAAMVTHAEGALVVALAWLYVLARLAHSWVHLGGNRLRQRIATYFASWLVLLGLWLAVAVNAAAP